jgi:AcrR family transcriptional regulator
MAAELGLRERKKAQTRRALNEAATRLFLERGFDNVTVAEVAEAAETAVTTLFKYFPEGKDALVFGPDDGRADGLVAAIRERPAGTDTLTAVERFIGARGPFDPRDGIAPELAQLIMETPALRAYAKSKWTDCEDVLAGELARQAGRSPDAELHALARFILHTPDLAGEAEDIPAAFHAIFDRLRRGWGEGN